MFETQATVGLTVSALPHEMIHGFQSEDILISIITEEATVESTPVALPIIETINVQSIRVTLLII